MGRDRWLLEAGLMVRGVWFLGRDHSCPICGWSFRSFVAGGGSFHPRPGGYCPRCNSKGRHRLAWSYLQENPGMLANASRVLHVSPHYSLGRRLDQGRGYHYVGVDLENQPHVGVRGDLRWLPFPSSSFDGVICIHVLEHVEEDQQAIAELYRVTRPGGWAFVNVPMSEDRLTLEGAAVTTPSQRREVYGEETHVRLYGRDLVQRLEHPGFVVEPVATRPYSEDEMVRYGLPGDEKSFVCTKPIEAGV